MPPQQVVLTVPAQPEFLRVVRMTASGLGSRLGFNIDEVDDLRLALDELCFTLIGKGIAGELRLGYTLLDDALVIDGSVAKEHAASTELNTFSAQILTALVDEHDLHDDGTAGKFTLTKRRASAEQPALS